MANLIIDFETRSRCDLKARGGDNYSLDPSTEILCMAACYADPENDKEWLWFPHDGALPTDLTQAIEDADLIMAHNAAFDRGIWYIGVDDHGFPRVAFDKWFCTSAQARVNALPASLDKLTQALDSEYKKNHRGNQLIKLLAIPDKATGEFKEDAQLLNEMGLYCLDDVRATKSAVNMMRPMTQVEHKDWLISERINERGIKVDLELAKGAMKYATMEQKEIGAELTELTAGGVTKHTQHKRISGWVLLRVDKKIQDMMTVHKDGEKKYSLDKNIRGELLEKADREHIELSEDVRRVIELVQLGSKSSVAKFGRMVGRADDDDSRVRGAFVYAGASQTLRYASRGLQLHNMARICFNAEQTEDLKEQMKDGYILEDDNGDLPVMQTLSKLLRPALIPETGKVFVVGDWSSIEARALPWLAQSEYAKDRLELFKQDVDIYVNTAEELGLGERQIGKVAELSLGYGGGLGAFSAMAKIYGVSMDDTTVSGIIQAWREKNIWATVFWSQLERAATLAIRNPSQEQTAGRVKYLYIEDLLGGVLLCILPGDLVIQYPKAKLESVDTKWGPRLNITAMKANWHPKQDEKEWPRVALWPGLLAENVTQAFCAGILRHSLRELHADAAPVVGHVHDEILLEVELSSAQIAKDELQRVMETPPTWAEGLPLKAEPVIMTRYGK